MWIDLKFNYSHDAPFPLSPSKDELDVDVVNVFIAESSDSGLKHRHSSLSWVRDEVCEPSTHCRTPLHLLHCSCL